MSSPGAGVEVAAQDGYGSEELLRRGRWEHEPDVAADDDDPDAADDKDNEGLVAAEEIRRSGTRGSVCSCSRSTSRHELRAAAPRRRPAAGRLPPEGPRAQHKTGSSQRFERVAGGRDEVVDPALVTQLVDRPRASATGSPISPPVSADVLALMAEGFTDRGISERLFITPKTTETHIRHIFEKLGDPGDAPPTTHARVHAVLAYLRAN